MPILTIIARFIASRAVVSAFVVALFGFLTSLGIKLPENAAEWTERALVGLTTLLSAGVAVWMAWRAPPPGDKAPAVPGTIDRIVGGLSKGGIVLLACLSVGCAGSFEEVTLASPASAAPRDAARCASLSDRRQLYGGAGKVLAGLSGGSGLSTIAVDDAQIQTGLAIGAGVAGALAAGAVYVSEAAGDSYAEECR